MNPRHLVTATLVAAAVASTESDSSMAGSGASERRPVVQTIAIVRNGSRPSSPGSAAYFTGSVQITPLFEAQEPARATGGTVTFAPGARSAWHTHPLGQTLIVTAGTGRVQRWGDAIEEIRPGDVIWIPPGQKHWHGAASTTGMTHIAIQERLSGTNVEWLEHVTDEQYRQ